MAIIYENSNSRAVSLTKSKRMTRPIAREQQEAIAGDPFIKNVYFSAVSLSLTFTKGRQFFFLSFFFLL